MVDQNLSEEEEAFTEEEKRAQLKELILCLDNNTLPSPETSAAISSRLQKYLEYELDAITDVLCKREYRYKVISIELGALATEVVNAYSDLVGQDKVSSAVMQDLFEVLAELSNQGEKAIQCLVNEYGFEGAENIFKCYCSEFEFHKANMESFKPEQDLSPSAIKKSYYEFKNQTIKQPRQRKSIDISDNHLGGWYAYRSSKAALNMIIKNTAIESCKA